MVSDTFPEFAPDNVETQLPCMAEELPNTDVALETLKDLDQHDRRVESEVGLAFQHEGSTYIFAHVNVHL